MGYPTRTLFVNLPSGIKTFYRIAGPTNGPVILLLHGFPTSSTQYRTLIPILADAGYRVIAPDLPGYGFTEVSASFEYSFANLAKTTLAFIDELKLTKFALYIMDYGAPTGLRIAIQRPDAVTAIITQNGNAYEEGLGEFWDPLKALWASTPGTQEETDLRAKIQDAILTYAATEWQYNFGEPKPETLDPASWHLDWALLQRPGNIKIQLDLFKSYGTNVELYPQFQEYFRKSQVPLLGAWGKNDQIFIKEGLAPFKKDLPNAELHYLDAGHFASLSQAEEIGELIIKFLGENGIKP